MNTHNGITYRVNVSHNTRGVTITSFGINRVDNEVDGHYSSVEALPNWMQERLATLSLLRVPPPPNDVDGVGARIGPYLFWVYN
jgi:hypothetical protein